MNGPERSIYYLRDIPVPETPPPGKDPVPWKKTEVVGARLPRVDAYERVSGTDLLGCLGGSLFVCKGCPAIKT